MGLFCLGDGGLRPYAFGRSRSLMGATWVDWKMPLTTELLRAGTAAELMRATDWTRVRRRDSLKTRMADIRSWIFLRWLGSGFAAMVPKQCNASSSRRYVFIMERIRRSFCPSREPRHETPQGLLSCGLCERLLLRRKNRANLGESLFAQIAF